MYLDRINIKQYCNILPGTVDINYVNVTYDLLVQMYTVGSVSYILNLSACRNLGSDASVIVKNHRPRTEERILDRPI